MNETPVTEKPQHQPDDHTQAPPTGQADGDAWFWTDEWQARHAEALDDLRSGRVRSYADTDAFLDSFHQPE